MAEFRCGTRLVPCFPFPRYQGDDNYCFHRCHCFHRFYHAREHCGTAKERYRRTSDWYLVWRHIHFGPSELDDISSHYLFDSCRHFHFLDGGHGHRTPTRQRYCSGGGHKRLFNSCINRGDSQCHVDGAGTPFSETIYEKINAVGWNK